MRDGREFFVIGDDTVGMLVIDGGNGGDDWINGITVSGEFKIDLEFGLDDDSSDDFFNSSSHVSSLLVP